MNNLFDTIEEAEAYLKIRQTESLSNIKDRGDVLLTDSSMVFLDFYSNKWSTMLLMYTQNMVDDFAKCKSFDFNAELEAILVSELKNKNDDSE